MIPKTYSLLCQVHDRANPLGRAAPLRSCQSCLWTSSLYPQPGTLSHNSLGHLVVGPEATQTFKFNFYTTSTQKPRQHAPFQRSDSKNHLHTLIPSIFGRLDVNYCSIPAPRYVYLGPYDPMKFSHPPRKCGSKPCTKANLVGNIHHTTKRCFMGSPERGLTQNKMHPAESQSFLV